MHSPENSVKQSAGFTILELLLSITIVALVMSVVYTAFHAGSMACTFGGERAQNFHSARLAMQDIMQAIENVEYGKTNYLSFVSDGEGTGSGASDSLEFATATKPALLDGRWHAGIARVKYVLAEGENGPVLQKWVTRITDEDFKDAYVIELSDTISGIDFKFLEEDDYTELWDSESKEKLPELVEVTLYVQEGEAAVPYRSAALIPNMKVNPSNQGTRGERTATPGADGRGVQTPVMRDRTGNRGGRPEGTDGTSSPRGGKAGGTSAPRGGRTGGGRTGGGRTGGGSPSEPSRPTT